MRMHVDFTDLNKEYPKDSYPLPEIKPKSDSFGGFKWKSFLDAYKGYHKVKMATSYKEEIAFHWEKGMFYYTKISFSM